MAKFQGKGKHLKDAPRDKSKYNKEARDQTKSFKKEERKPYDKSKSSDKPEEKKPKVLTRDDRKALKEKSRGNRKFAEEENQLKKVFTMNISTLSREQQIAEATKLIEVSKGKLVSLCQRRSSAKSIQLVIKYGTKEVRQIILDEFKGKVKELY
eukprot:UN04204